LTTTDYFLQLLNPELAYTCKCLSYYLVSLLLAEKKWIINYDFRLKLH